MKKSTRFILILQIVFCLLMISGCGQKTANDIVYSTEEVMEPLEEQTDFYDVEVSLEGGTGKATINNPTVVECYKGEWTATIVWSSNKYDYMIVDGKKYYPINEEHGILDHSIFQIPVEDIGKPLNVIADTVAMSTPHEIEYTITFSKDSMSSIEGNYILNIDGDDKDNPGESENSKAQTSDGIDEQTGASDKTNNSSQNSEIPKTKTVCDIEFELLDEIEYATEFQIYKSKKGYLIFHINEVGDYLWVPSNLTAPKGVPKDVCVINQPKNIYVASTSVMDLYQSLGLLRLVRFTGTQSKDWCIDSIKEAIEKKEILYAGKYSAPDMELLLSYNCDLAIENTMIYHKPEIKEQLEKLGIPVIVERSSYESDPLGRMEWIKFYGYMSGIEDYAKKVFDKEVQELEPILGLEKTDQTVAFFYVSSNGSVNVRKSDDYVSKMIELAGGNYALKDMKMVDDGTNMSTINLQMEAFYEAAKDADILIYNSTIDGEIYTLDELYKKSPLFKDFKAVKEGNVYCTGKNMFQESMSLSKMIQDLHQAIKYPDSVDEDFYFLHCVK